jgi:hypothetical protein
MVLRSFLLLGPVYAGFARLSAKIPVGLIVMVRWSADASIPYG